MQTARFALILAMCSLLAVAAFAAGGTEKKIQKPSSTPEQEATQHYNRGLQLRDSAWKAETKLGAETDAGKRAKLEGKIRRFYEKAVEEQLAATRLNRRFHEAYSSLGYAYRKLGDFEAALKSYDAALDLSPSYAEAIEYRGQAYLGLNRIDEAKQAYVSLFGKDAEKAGTLLTAMAAWAEAGPEGVPATTVESVRSWIRERAEIAKQAGQASAGRGNW